MINWSTEQPQIEAAAPLYGVDATFICAIRHQENGPPSAESGHEFGEFGVPTADAPDYQSQLATCCATVRDRMAEYMGPPFLMMQGPKVKRLAYARAFISWFASKWAPVGANNDTGNINQFWPSNVMAAYYGWIALGRVQ